MEVISLMFSMYIYLKFQVSVLSRLGGVVLVVGWSEVIIRLISAEAETEALLGLAELGNKYNSTGSNGHIKKSVTIIQ